MLRFSGTSILRLLSMATVADDHTSVSDNVNEMIANEELANGNGATQTQNEETTPNENGN